MTLSTISDNPIRFESEDHLDRARFAEGLANLILSADADANLRIGIYGRFGDGKSSVIELMKRRIELEKHVVIHLTSWAKSNEELLEILIRELADAVGLGTSAFTRAWAKWVRALTKPLRKLTILDPELKAADAVLGDAVEEVFTGLVKKAEGQQTALILRFLQEQLKGRKVVVFIDDVDRVPPDRLPDLLLRLREALNQPNYFYVMALDPEAVERGLESINTKWGEPSVFLDKIIELPRYLPTPTTGQILRLMHAQLDKLRNRPSREALDALGDLLPRNPRKLKIFLRLLATAGVDQARFDVDEIQWDLFYALQLLRVEFPQEAARMADDESMLKNFEHESMVKFMAMKRDDEKAEPSYTRYIPAARKERFVELCTAVQARPRMHGRYSLPYLLLLPDQPPMITRKEARAFLERFRNAASGGHTVELVRMVSPRKDVDAAVVRELFDHMIELRQFAIQYAIEQPTSELMDAGLGDVDLIDDALFLIVTDLRAFESNLLESVHWWNLLRHFAQWAGWVRPPHDRLRRREVELLREMALTGGQDVWRELVNHWDPDALFYAPEFRKNIEELRIEMVRLLAADFIASLGSPDDPLSAVYGEQGRWLKIVAFSLRSPLFEDDDLRKKLLDMAAAASTNLTVQINFVSYVGLLNYGAYGEAFSFDRSVVRELLGDAEIVTVFWRAATARPLQMREAGSLIVARRNIVDGGASSAALPIPEWMLQFRPQFSADIQAAFEDAPPPSAL